MHYDMHYDSDTAVNTKETMFGDFQVVSCLSYQLSYTSHFNATADIDVTILPTPLLNPVFPRFPLSDMLEEMVVPMTLIMVGKRSTMLCS